jgi:hypothetical protein
MSGIREYSKILIKRTALTGVVPTIPIDDNDLDNFLDTDILTAELYFNIADRILYTRAGDEIIIIGGSSEIDNVLLQELIGLVEKCCLSGAEGIHNIMNTLDIHSKYFEYLMKCCKVPVRPTKPKPLIPGQAVDYIVYNKPEPYKPQGQIKPQTIEVIPVRKDNEESNLILYPSEKGYFSVLGIPGDWSVKDLRIVDKSGVDLESHLPIYFNDVVCENKVLSLGWVAATGKDKRTYETCIELSSIRGYSIKDTSAGKKTPLLIYETKNSNKVTRTFEGSTSLWYRYATNQ